MPKHEWIDEVWSDLIDAIYDGTLEEKAIIAQRWANRKKKTYRRVSFNKSNKANPKKGENNEIIIEG